MKRQVGFTRTMHWSLDWLIGLTEKCLFSSYAHLPQPLSDIGHLHFKWYLIVIPSIWIVLDGRSKTLFNMAPATKNQRPLTTTSDCQRTEHYVDWLIWRISTVNMRNSVQVRWVITIVMNSNPHLIATYFSKKLLMDALCLNKKWKRHGLMGWWKQNWGKIELQQKTFRRPGIIREFRD